MSSTIQAEKQYTTFTVYTGEEEREVTVIKGPQGKWYKRNSYQP